MQHLLSVNVTFHQTLEQENTRLVSDLQILVDEALTKKTNPFASSHRALSKHFKWIMQDST